MPLPPSARPIAGRAMSDVSGFAFASPDDAVAAVIGRLAAVGNEVVPLTAAAGRVLAEAVRADRDSPACDVSSMDGYAVRVAELAMGSLPVRGDARIGQVPPALPPAAVVKIVTGAPLPDGADAVVRREDVDESDPAVMTLRIAPDAVRHGQSIRRRGENLRWGGNVIAAGARVAPPVVAALATFGGASVRVHRRVRVAVLTTGDELLPVDAAPSAWQVRDANGPALRAVLSAAAWADVAPPRHVPDDPDALRRHLADSLATGDAVVLTGGVSMGDYDYVPRVATELGARVVFHKLPVRPGKPILAAVGPSGQLIVGLPGNPVSALAGMCRMVGPMLRHLAGFARPVDAPPTVTLDNADAAAIGLWWWRLVRTEAAGRAALVETRGSGDAASAARSDGFVELPPGAHGTGPWPIHRWEV